jgi:MFS transporter, DHA2 family, multidrug resistance protein
VGILAFFLVNRLVRDPPWIEADRANLRKLDYIGLGLLTGAMGGMQIMLDNGEEDDWFASTFIRVFGLLFVSGMAGLIWWQWRAKNPIMNLRLFKYNNFAICCFLMILISGVLNAATVLQPEFLQELMGYTATLAGRALMSGGRAVGDVMTCYHVENHRIVTEANENPSAATSTRSADLNRKGSTTSS